MHTPFRNLNPSLNTCGFHPGGNIDGIAPNVVIQFRGTNDSGSDITKVESDPVNWKKIKKLMKQIKNFYRPGQLNWEFWLWMEIPQCGNLAIFLGLWFHVKTILADFRRSIIAVLTILGFEFWFLVKFHTLQCQNSQKFKSQINSNNQNGSFWGSKMTKIDFTWNLSIRKVPKFPHSKFTIRLPRSV